MSQGERLIARGLGRRGFLRLSAGSALGLAAVRCASSAPEPAPAAPATPLARPTLLAEPVAATVEPTVAPSRLNVLLITVDTWRTDYGGGSGGLAQTPYADRLAAEGVRFTNAYAQLPQTTPSHAALFTGQYPATSGVRVSLHQRVAPDAVTLASMFAEQGYRTGGLYSWYSLDDAVVGLARGFQTYENLNVRVGTRDVLPPGAALAAREAGETPERLADARADVTTDAAVAWLEDAARQPAQPFFLWVHYRDPHYPYEPPSPYDSMYAPPCGGCADGSFATLGRIWEGWQPPPADLERIRAAYAGEVSFTDAELGRLLARLDGLGLGAHTLVVLTADHGEAFGEHDEWFHGYKVYQPTAQVPLVLRLPGVLPVGATVASAAQLVDLMPTVLDLAELSPAPTVDGRSLAPAALGGSLGDHAAITEVADNRYHAIVVGDWKLVRDNQAGRQALYHLPSDPAEQNDRLAANRATARDLEALLAEWQTTRAAGTPWQR
jgi:choline-sulfatase